MERDTRNAGATSEYEAVATSLFVLADPPCGTPSVAIDPLSPQGTRTIVSFTASTSGCPHPLFEFWMLPPGGTWTSPLTTAEYDALGRDPQPSHQPARDLQVVRLPDLFFLVKFVNRGGHSYVESKIRFPLKQN